MTRTPDNFRIDVDQAAKLIAEHMPSYEPADVPLEQAAGAILQQPVFAERDQPPFNRVTMDGIAVRASALAAGTRRFTRIGTQGAGAEPLKLGADDHCIEIMTGAMLPADADTVIPIERLTISDDQVSLEAGYQPNAGQFVHLQGSDHVAGQSLLEPGTRIGPTQMAVLTITGSANVRIARWPRIAVVSTGDELVDVGEPVELFQIRSSNDRAILTALEQRGCQTAHRSRLPDDPDALRESITTLHAQDDILILSGGVSMGKYDYVPQIMEELGMSLVFHKILQRPGLPMWFGVSKKGKPIFALPGNPVSSLVCLVRYVLPAIQATMGPAQDLETARLTEAVEFKPDLTCFFPVKLRQGPGGEQQAIPKPTNTSGDFVSLAGTDGFVELQRGQTHFPADEPLPLFRW
ncbi:MAG: molybdopterin molybdotransferase MoeA [Gammaproteobacteria bacterium]|nr:molybdopterin molybdotransferase MoeA [Gammaproteobacteria bacterium]